MKVGDWIKCVDAKGRGEIYKNTWYRTLEIDFENRTVCVEYDVEKKHNGWYPFSYFDTDYPMKDNPNTVGCDCESVVKKEEIIEPEQRFLHKQTGVLCEVTDLMLGDLPMMSIPLRVVSVSNDTFRDGGTKMGGCTRELTFPFDANIDITHFDNCTAEDLINTLVHELTHAFSHRLAFFRNGVESWDKLDEAEECFCRMSGTIASNVFKNYDKIKKYLDEYLNNIPKK